jgi:nitrite reductase (NO-forming)
MNISRRIALLGVAGAAGAAGLAAVSGTNTPPAGASALAEAAPAAPLGREKVNLAIPPFVHPHNQVANRPPVIKEFRLTVEEKTVVVDDDGTKMHAMTYNGSIPAPLMVVHEGDYIELALVNPATSAMAHNIDFHASTGALGGAALTLVNPGEEAVLRFKATRPGVFVYHCAPGGPMIPWHVVSGMNGAVMVLPRDGLKDATGKLLHYDRV